MRNSALGLASLVLGLAGLFLCWNIWGIIPCIVAIILGIIALTDYLAYKWSSMCGISLAIMAIAVMVYRFGLPVAGLYAGRVITKDELPQEYQDTIDDALSMMEELVSEEQPVSDNAVVAVNDTKNEKVIENKNIKKDYYDIGETWNAGEWEFTITGVRETAERNPYSDKNPEAVYIVSFKINNIAYKDKYWEGLFISVDDHIVDSVGEMGYSYPATEYISQQETMLGAYQNAETVIGVNHAGDFTLTISKYDSKDNKQTAKFKCTVG